MSFARGIRRTEAYIPAFDNDDVRVAATGDSAAAAAAVHDDVLALRPSKTEQRASKRETQLKGPSRKRAPLPTPPGEICRQPRRWSPSGDG